MKEKESHISQKLEIINLNEEGMLKDNTVWKLGFLHQMVCYVVNEKEKFLKETHE